MGCNEVAMTKHLISFGHGYSAQALAKLLPREGWHITATTRTAEKAERLAAPGIDPVIWPGTDLGAALSNATHLLISAAPGPDGDPVLAALEDQIAQNGTHFEWVGYLSTTGVYGDHGGAWVDEETPLSPSTKRGEARVKAEAAWQKLAVRAGLPLHIFRLAGIYGPNRRKSGTR